LVTWADLNKLNYKTGEMPESLRQLIGKSVKIPGFAVPLEGDGGFDYIKEFLLVPTFGACIHVPPPPPNQVIQVILDEPEHLKNFYMLFGLLVSLKLVNTFTKVRVISVSRLMILNLVI
jgi:hypothetical protein